MGQRSGCVDTRVVAPIISSRQNRRCLQEGGTPFAPPRTTVDIVRIHRGLLRPAVTSPDSETQEPPVAPRSRRKDHDRTTLTRSDPDSFSRSGGVASSNRRPNIHAAIPFAGTLETASPNARPGVRNTVNAPIEKMMASEGHHYSAATSPGC